MVGGGGGWLESDYSVCTRPLLLFLQFFQFMLVRLRQFTSEGQDVELNNCDPNGRSYISKDIALKSVEREERCYYQWKKII